MVSSYFSNSVPTEQNSENQEAEFEALSRELAEKELELATLENELLIFEKRYASRVAVLFAELDRLDQEIARELFRLNPEEKYRQGVQRAEQKARVSQEAVHEEAKREQKPPYIPTEEIKNLFRKVAKVIHPDLAVNEAEYAFRTDLMARANAAYRKGDKGALEQILYEWEHREETSLALQPAAKETPTFEQRIARVKARLQQIETRIAELKMSDLYQLMKRVERADQEGRDLLGDMVRDLQVRIREAGKLLDSLREQERR